MLKRGIVLSFICGVMLTTGCNFHRINSKAKAESQTSGSVMSLQDSVAIKQFAGDAEQNSQLKSQKYIPNISEFKDLKPGCSPKELKWSVVSTLPHNRSFYSQGFFYQNGFFYESTGEYGQSQLLQIIPTTGNPVKSIRQKSFYFSEGICLLNGRIFQLTWCENTCFEYDFNTFECIKTNMYNHEGWGIATDGTKLFVSDGTPKLRFINPENFSEEGFVNVSIEGHELDSINEMEYIEGLLWANVYLTDFIVLINPENGAVVAQIDLTGLLPDSLRNSQTDVLNGIAYDPQSGRIWLSGKYWPKIFEIELER